MEMMTNESFNLPRWHQEPSYPCRAWLPGSSKIVRFCFPYLTLTKLLAYLTLRKLLIPLYHPAKLLIPLSLSDKIADTIILPWENCYAYLTLTGPFPGRWPRLICFPGRLVGFRWFLGGRWVVSRGRARNWKDRCHCLGISTIVTKKGLCFLKNWHFMFLVDYLIKRRVNRWCIGAPWGSWGGLTRTSGWARWQRWLPESYRIIWFGREGFGSYEFVAWSNGDGEVGFL